MLALAAAVPGDYPAIVSAHIIVYQFRTGNPVPGVDAEVEGNEFWNHPDLSQNTVIFSAELLIADAGYPNGNQIPTKDGDWLDLQITITGGSGPFDLFAEGHPWHEAPGNLFIQVTDESIFHFALAFQVGFESYGFPRYLGFQPTSARNEEPSRTLNEPPNFIVLIPVPSQDVPEPSACMMALGALTVLYGRRS